MNLSCIFSRRYNFFLQETTQRACITALSKRLKNFGGDGKSLSATNPNTIKENAKHGFRDPGVPAKMKQLRNAVRKVLVDLNDEDFNQIIEIIKAQKEYG